MPKIYTSDHKLCDMQAVLEEVKEVLQSLDSKTCNLSDEQFEHLLSRIDSYIEGDKEREDFYKACEIARQFSKE